jgi:hypothetical protein
MRANPLIFARTPVNRARVLRRTAGPTATRERQRFYGLLRRMRAKLVLSKMERKQ